MAGWVTEPTTGQPVFQGDDGLVHVTKFDGTVHAVAPEQAQALLGDKLSGFKAATADDLNRQQDQQKWDETSLATKAGFYAREAVKSAVDSATALPRAALAAGGAVAGKLTGTEIGNPLEALSGENVVEKLESIVSGDEQAKINAERQRQLAGVAPGKELADIAGFVAGSAGLGALGSVGKALTGAELLGDASAAARVGNMAVQGAAQGYAAGAEDAWVKDHAFTADAALANMGVGALLGGGLGAVGEGVKAIGGGARAALAEKVFGKSRLSRDASEAAEQMAEDVVGTKPPEGFAKYFKETMDAIRDKVESVQSVASGIPKEDLEKYGGLRWTEEAISAREAHANRGPILEAVSNDLTSSLENMYSESRPILDEVSRATGAKAKNIAANLTGDVDTMMNAARDKASAISDAVSKLKEEEATTGTRAVLGSGAQTEDLHAAMEDVVKNVDAAANPAEAYDALDEFKARMQRVKKNAEATSYRVTSGLQIEQARARASFAQQISDDMQGYLEDSSIWGKQGDVQARVNKAYRRVLDNDKYISQHLFERTGDEWGVPRYQVDPRKVAGYVEGIGTLKTKIVDGMLRDNIAARKELADAIVSGYGLTAHEGGLQKLISSVDNAQSLLKKATDTVSKANVIEEMFKRAASARDGHAGAMVGGILGHAPGAALGAVADVLMNPAKMMQQAVSLREAAVKWNKSISSDVGAALLARGAKTAGAVASSVAKTARVVATQAVARTAEERGAAYERAAKSVVTATADPIGMATSMGSAVAHIDHPEVRDLVIGGALRGAQFLNSKLPGPVYGGSPLTPNQLNAVSAAQQARFLRYYETVNDPSIVFKELASGKTPAPEHIETLKTVYPAFYQKAQQVVMETVHSTPGGRPLPLQTRLSLAEMFDVPGAIEPTLDPAFMQRITQTAQQGASAEAQKQQQAAPKPRAIKGDISDPMKSRLDNLHL